MSVRSVVLTSLSLLALPACAPSVDTAAEEQTIRDIAVRWGEMEDQGDAAGVAALFADDARLAWEDAPATQGRADIEAFLAREFEQSDGEGGFSTERVHVAASGDLAVEEGTWQGGTTSGRYMTMYAKDAAGTWKVRSDMSVETAPNGGAPDWAQTELDKWYEAYNARDAQAMGALYARDARVRDAVGRPAIVQRFRTGWARDNDTCQGAYDEFEVVEPLAVGFGRDTCTSTVDGETRTTHSRWMAVMERQADGRWLLIRDFAEPMGG